MTERMQYFIKPCILSLLGPFSGLSFSCVEQVTEFWLMECGHVLVSSLENSPHDPLLCLSWFVDYKCTIQKGTLGDDGATGGKGLRDPEWLREPQPSPDLHWTIT